MYSYEELISLSDAELREIARSQDSARPVCRAILDIQDSYVNNPDAPQGQMLVSDKPKFAALGEKFDKIRVYAKEAGWG